MMHEPEQTTRPCEAYLEGVGTRCATCGWGPMTHKAAHVFDWQTGLPGIFAERIVPMSEQELLQVASRTGQAGHFAYDPSIRPDPYAAPGRTWWEEGWHGRH